MANVDEIGFFSHAETLGYDSVWVTDSQMLYSDCYAVLALAARQTTKLRLGPGTAICGSIAAIMRSSSCGLRQNKWKAWSNNSRWSRRFTKTVWRVQ